MWVLGIESNVCLLQDQDVLSATKPSPAQESSFSFSFLLIKPLISPRNLLWLEGTDEVGEASFECIWFSVLLECLFQEGSDLDFPLHPVFPALNHRCLENTC